MEPLFQQLVSVVGRRADDPVVMTFVTDTLGQKLPTPTTDAAHTKYVIAKKHGLELAFTHDIKNEKYPLVPKAKKTFVPYLSLAWLGEKFRDVPFGLKRGMSADELSDRLGPPKVRGSAKWSVWVRTLDADRDVFFRMDTREVAVAVSQSLVLSSRSGVPSNQVTGLFVAWAARRGLLDETRVGRHAPLLAEVKAGARQGSELLAAAWPRGLWDAHLADKPGLREFAHAWFHNIEVGFIRDDLVAVFGGREGPLGHTEPVLDDDTADAVSKATPALDARFAAWLV